MCWGASYSTALCNSASLAALTVILFTITEWPETDVATSRVLILFRLKMLSMASLTAVASMMSPSTTTSWPKFSRSTFSSS